MKISAVQAPTSAPMTNGGVTAGLRSIRMNPTGEPAAAYSQANSPPGPLIEDNIETPAVTEDTQPLSPQFAELAKRRRALQLKERELMDRERAAAGQSAGADSIPLARLKSEPLKVLMESGVTYDQLTEAILANQGNPEINSLKSEIASLKEGIDKRFNESSAAAERQVLSEMRREAVRLASTGDAYALVRETGNIPQVTRLIEQNYRATGEIMEVEEALQSIEDLLFEDAQKLSGIEKVRNQYAAPQMQPPMRQEQWGPSSQPRMMRTLTNRDTAQQPPLSPKQRAVAAFEGRLRRQ